MNETEKPKKSNGVIGRSSTKTIQKRHELCLNVIYENEKLTTKRFISKCREAYQSAGIEVPSNGTILNDAYACNLYFKYGYAEFRPNDTPFCRIGKNLGYNIKQIRVLCSTFDFLLFNYTDSEIPNTKKAFLSPLDILNNSLKGDNNNTTSLLSKTSLVTLLIILKEYGFEKHIENAFITTSPKDFLYIESHGFCVKVIFELKDLASVLNKVYDIIDGYRVKLKT